MSDIPQEIPVTEKIEALWRHVHALEQWAAQFPPLGVISENGKPGLITGPLTFTVPEGCKMPAPVDAGGEDAAVHPIGQIAFDLLCPDQKHVDVPQLSRSHAMAHKISLAILAAIRAGKVPGIVHEDDMSPNELLERDLINDNDALRARLAAAERRADEMEGKAGEWIAVEVHKERVESARADAVAMNKRLLGERDAAWKENVRILARVAELEAERARCDNPVLAILDQQHETVVAERDRALALAESRLKSYNELEANRDAIEADLAAERGEACRKQVSDE